jgi:hypothetical protein
MARGLSEKYLRETWPVVTRALKEHGISCELNLVSSVLSLSFNDRMSVGLHVFHMQNSRRFQAHCTHSIIVRMDSVGLHYHWWWTDRWRVQWQWPQHGRPGTLLLSLKPVTSWSCFQGAFLLLRYVMWHWTLITGVLFQGWILSILPALFMHSSIYLLGFSIVKIQYIVQGQV